MIDPNISEALRRVEQRFAELDQLLADPAVVRDPRKLRDLSRERSRIGETVRVSGESRAGCTPSTPSAGAGSRRS